MSELLQKALTAIELREAALLSWGAVGAEWRRDELVALLRAHGDGERLLDEMVELALIVETPSGGYRSRSAETVRLLATLRQAFRGEAVLSGRPLVLDYRFLQRPRRRPRRDVPAAGLETAVGDSLASEGIDALRALAPDQISAFQQRSTQQVLEALNTTEAAGVVVTAGTGSGKTLAFYMPMLAWICDNARSPAGSTCPRPLSAQRIAEGPVARAGHVRHATPGNRGPLESGYPRDVVRRDSRVGQARPQRQSRLVAQSGRRLRLPVLALPERRTARTARSSGRMRNSETTPSCFVVRPAAPRSPGSLLRLTRESARAHPPRVMLSTTESLNRQLSSPGNLRAFGVVHNGLRAVLLDEVHTYEGTTGAQNAYLLRRLRKALGYEPFWAGLSATLADAADFFGRLVDLDAGRVSVVEPDAPNWRSPAPSIWWRCATTRTATQGPLSTTIQTAMALSRSLDPMVGNPVQPAGRLRRDLR